MTEKTCTLGETPNQFQQIAFEDTYDHTCFIEQSSIILDKYGRKARQSPGYSALLIGPATTPQTRPPQAQNGSIAERMHPMHLNRDEVLWLIGILRNWLKTGTLYPRR